MNPVGAAMSSSISATRGICFMDLDGTLLCSDHSLSTANRQALEDLGERNITRVLATGRSLHSCSKVLFPDFPADYVIFSTGAGVARMGDQKIIRHSALKGHEIHEGIRILRTAGIDFMLHHPIPDNHLFEFEHNGNPNPDFMTRLEAHKEWGTPLPPDASWETASQFVAILPPGLGLGPLEHVRKQLPDLSIIRATSPFDHASTWVEIFPAGVSKATTGRWLCEFLGVPLDKTMAIGNDYNDLDLLEMSPHPYVVANAPDELTGRFTTVADNDHDGVATALGTWTTTVLAG